MAEGRSNQIWVTARNWCTVTFGEAGFLCQQPGRLKRKNELM